MLKAPFHSLSCFASVFPDLSKDVQETLKKCSQYFGDAAESYAKVSVKWREKMAEKFPDISFLSLWGAKVLFVHSIAFVVSVLFTCPLIKSVLICTNSSYWKITFAVEVT